MVRIAPGALERGAFCFGSMRLRSVALRAAHGTGHLCDAEATTPLRENLARAGASVDDTEPERKRKVVAAINEAAEILGNTPAVCRSSYICPEIIESFEQGIVIRRYFQTVAELVKHRTRGLHVVEKALLSFLKRGGKKARKKNGT